MIAPLSTAAPTGWADYARALDRVALHIEQHLDEPLDLARLADVACLSAHHFHRVYHAMRGETLAATVQRLRLQRAAWWLAHSEEPVARIARRCGYTGATAFTRRFRLAYGSTPAVYRRQGPHRVFRPPPSGPDVRDAASLQVELREMPAMTLVVVHHQGPYIRIGQAFERVLAHTARQGRATGGTVPQVQRMVGVYLDDPAAVSASALRSLAGLQLADPFTDQDGWQPPLQRWTVPAGPCAVLRYRGPYASMHAAYRWLFGQWLPHSGRQPAEHPVWEDYLNDPRQVAPADLLTDIVLPLRAV